MWHQVIRSLLIASIISKTYCRVRPYNETTALVLCNITTSLPKVLTLISPWSCPNTAGIKNTIWCNSWTGIKCNIKRQIISLQLPDSQLIGTLPSSIGLLTSLTKYLWLFNNRIHGTIPSSLSSLSKLASLRLDENSLTGTVPSSLSLLTFLSTLNLNNNYLTGTLPSYFTSATYNDDGQISPSSFNQLTYYPTSQPTGQPSGQPTGQPSTYANMYINC